MATKAMAEHWEMKLLKLSLPSGGIILTSTTLLRRPMTGSPSDQVHWCSFLVEDAYGTYHAQI